MKGMHRRAGACPVPDTARPIGHTGGGMGGEDGGVWRETGIVREGGVPVLIWRMALPCPAQETGAGQEAAGLRRVAAGYRAMARQICPRITEEGGGRAAAVYRADPDRRKRFTFAPYILHMTCEVTQGHSGLFCVRRTVMLCRRGQVLGRREMGEAFDVRTGRLLSPLSLRLRGVQWRGAASPVSAAHARPAALGQWWAARRGVVVTGDGMAPYTAPEGCFARRGKCIAGRAASHAII